MQCVREPRHLAHRPNSVYFLPSKGNVVVLRLVGLGLGLRLLLRLGLLELGLVAVLDGVDDPMSEAVIACTANIRGRF